MRTVSTKLDHPPYLPDLAPCDFFAFSQKFKIAIISGRFSDIQRHVNRILQLPEILKTMQEIHNTFLRTQPYAYTDVYFDWTIHASRDGQVFNLRQLRVLIGRDVSLARETIL